MNADGSLEFMIHRNLGQDDGRGLSERVDDNSVVYSYHWLMLEPSQETEIRRQRMQLMLEHPLRLVSAKESVGSVEEWVEQYGTQYSPLESKFSPFSFCTNVYLSSSWFS
jgi:hypothetical protein